VTPVDCTCDNGATDGGICPDCLGWGWYLTLTADDERLLAARGN
jgi:hypothetical protein